MQDQGQGSRRAGLGEEGKKRGHRKAGTGTVDCWAPGIYPKGGKWPCWPGSTFHSLGGDPGPGRAGDGSHSPSEPRMCASADTS